MLQLFKLQKVSHCTMLFHMVQMISVYGKNNTAAATFVFGVYCSGIISCNFLNLTVE